MTVEEPRRLSQAAIDAMEAAWHKTKQEERDTPPQHGADLDFDAFVRAYKRAALWSTNDESDERGGDPLDENYTIDDFTEEANVTIRRECWLFFRDNRKDLLCQDDTDAAGYDFWMTRNGHGVGFWEYPDWPRAEGERLTEEARKVGECWLVVTSDGKIDQA